MPPRIRMEGLDLGYFEGRTVYDHVTGCLIWVKGSIAGDGYAYCWISRKPYYGHRLAFYLKWGRWPTEAMHSCDRKSCVAWWHIEDGTRSQNTRDAYARGRRRPKRPESMHNTHLDWPQVREIRRIRAEEGLTYREIGERFGIAQNTTRYICKGQTWKE
ncbi:HNH endonuclease [Streptomyces nodosus]|uniref:HNH endonuclease n=1 Tax=Streptomyces nodosus TaxID=40318 RepID=UPI003452FBBA